MGSLRALVGRDTHRILSTPTAPDEASEKNEAHMMKPGSMQEGPAIFKHKFLKSKISKFQAPKKRNA